MIGFLGIIRDTDNVLKLVRITHPDQLCQWCNGRFGAHAADCYIGRIISNTPKQNQKSPEIAESASDGTQRTS
jgi:hypothetical protein